MIDEIIAKSAVLKRLKESGYRTSKSSIYKASILHVLANLGVLEDDPSLLAKTGTTESMKLALQKISEGVEC